MEFRTEDHNQGTEFTIGRLDMKNCNTPVGYVRPISTWIRHMRVQIIQQIRIRREIQASWPSEHVFEEEERVFGAELAVLSMEELDLGETPRL